MRLNVIAIGLTALLMALAGCGGNNAPVVIFPKLPLPTVSNFGFAYAANDASGTLDSYTIGLDYSLKPLATLALASPLPTSYQLMALSDVQGGEYVALLDSAANTLSVYEADANTGKLTAIEGSPIATGKDPVELAVGNVEIGYDITMYVANAGDQTLSTYVLSGGSQPAVQAQGQPVPAPVPATTLAVANYDLYIAGPDPNSTSGGQALWHFKLDPQTLSPQAPAGNEFPLSGASHPVSSLEFSIYGTYLYAFCPEDGMILGFNYSFQGGGLTLLPGSPYRLGSQPEGMMQTLTSNLSAMNPTYILDRAGFLVNAGTDSQGNLAAIGQYAAGVAPSDLAFNTGSGIAYNGQGLLEKVDPGSLLYVTDSASGDILGFSVNPASGALAALPGSPYPAGQAPAAIVTLPNAPPTMN